MISVNVVNDLLKKYIDQIKWSQSKSSRKWKETKNAIIMLRRRWRVTSLPANVASGYKLKQTIETIAVIGRSSNVSLILIAQDWNVDLVGFQPLLRNQISKVALGHKSSLQYLFPDIWWGNEIPVEPW